MTKKGVHGVRAAHTPEWVDFGHYGKARIASCVMIFLSLVALVALYFAPDTLGFAPGVRYKKMWVAAVAIPLVLNSFNVWFMGRWKAAAEQWKKDHLVGAAHAAPDAPEKKEQ
jgi:hypothetical protein